MIRLAGPVDTPTVEITVDHERTVDVAAVLRGFDRARRQLSCEVTGSRGIGVGYDQLTIHWANLATLEEGAEIRILAVLYDKRANRHAVEFTASTASRDEGAIKTLVHARGWTVTANNEQGDLS